MAIDDVFYLWNDGEVLLLWRWSF